MNKYFSKSYPSYTTSSYAEMLKFKKYDGVTLNGLCKFVVKIFTYINNKEYSNLVFINNNDTNCIVNNLKKAEIDYIIGERDGYYYLSVLPSSANNQTIYTEIMYCENPSFIEPLNMQAFNKKKTDYTLLTINNSYVITNSNFNLQSSKFCKLGEIVMYQTHRFVGNFTITNMETTNLLYCNFLIQAYKNAGNEMNVAMTVLNSNSNFIIGNVNIYYVINGNVLELYIKNNKTSTVQFDINMNYEKTNSIYDFEIKINSDLDNIDTSNPLLS